MKTKKLISVIAAAALAMTSFVSLAVTASAEDYELEFFNGEIRGCMTDLPSEFVVPATINGERVISIGNDAFHDQSNLTSVTISPGIETIGGDAFVDCQSLKTITIPESVMSIGDNVFMGCESLETIIYGGSEEQWNNSKQGELWSMGEINPDIYFNGEAPIDANVDDIKVGDILDAGFEITANKPLNVFLNDTKLYLANGSEKTFTLPADYADKYIVTSISGWSTYYIDISTYIPVQSVSFAESSLSLVAGNTGSLAATVSPSNAYNKGLTWTSSDNSVATVSGSGVVTAKAAGTATITATSNMDNTKSASYTVTVTMPTTVTGAVNQVVANNSGNDDGATAFITTLTKSGDGEISISSVTWNVTSPAKGESKSFTKSLPTMTFSGENTSATVALVISNLYDAAATADVTVQ